MASQMMKTSELEHAISFIKSLKAQISAHALLLTMKNIQQNKALLFAKELLPLFNENVNKWGSLTTSVAAVLLV